MDPPRQNRPQPTNADLKAQNQAWIQEVEKERGGGTSSAPDIGKGREGEASAASSSRPTPSIVTTTPSGPGIIVPGAQGGGGTNFLNDGTAETGAGAAPVAKKGVKTALDRVMSAMSILAMETANPEATLNTGGYPGGGGPEENAGAGMQTSILATKVAEIGLGAVFGIVTKGTRAVGEVVEEGVENADSVVGKVVKGADEGGESAAKGGAAKAARGIAREEQVAKHVGGEVSREEVVTSVGRTDLDVIGPNGELIAVGGPAKAKNLGKLGTEIKKLKLVAEERGVKAQAFFEEGTPEEVLKFAAERLGVENVFVFNNQGFRPFKP
jgi:hypothetical protein